MPATGVRAINSCMYLYVHIYVYIHIIIFVYIQSLSVGSPGPSNREAFERIGAHCGGQGYEITYNPSEGRIPDKSTAYVVEAWDKNELAQV